MSPTRTDRIRPLLMLVVWSLTPTAVSRAAFDFNLNVAGFSAAELDAIADAQALWRM